MKGYHTDNLTGIEARVLQYIRNWGLVVPGEGILAGVSGGADSVCLLFMLLKTKEVFGGRLRIEVLHIHHMLRAQEADGDMHYVEELCRRYDVPFHGVCCPVGQIAAEQGMSIEEAGRSVRYQEFERVRREQGLDKIAVAHHRDDNAETILMNLFRGTGIKGMAGIQPCLKNIIRPLLDLSRAEIEQYLLERGLSFRVDSSNEDCNYTRNRIRNELLPYLEKNINARCVQHVIQFGLHAGQIDCYFQKRANLLLEKYAEIEANMVILCLECLSCAEIELTYLVRTCLEQLHAGLKDIGNVHISQIIELMHGKTGRQLRLPDGICVQKSYERIIFSREDGAPAAAAEASVSKEIAVSREDAPLTVSFSEAEFTFHVKSVKKNQTFPKKKYTKWFDYDKIKVTLQLRTRKSGDYIVINAAGGHKKLKDYFIDSRLARSEREKTILLAAGSEILWVVGMRISEAYKVREDTRTILEVVCRGKAYTEE